MTPATLGGNWDVIFTNLAGDPSNAVPGFSGVSFDPGTGTTHFDQIFASPNGHWAIVAHTDLPTTEDEVLIVDGVVQVREGTNASWAPGELVGLLDTKIGINDSGMYALATNTDGPTGADEYIISGTIGGSQVIVVQEGDPIPGLSGASWGSTLESAVITADGTVGLVSDNVSGVVTTENEIAVLGNTILAQEGVTVPTGQIGSEAWENFDLNDFWVSADGSHYLLQGDLFGSTSSDDVVVVDGAVVLQEDSIIPGSGFTNPIDGSGIVGVFMDAVGNWYARGNNDTTEQDWVVRNGTVVAKGGDAIGTGFREAWDDTDFSDLFFLHVGNSSGAYVLGGVTDADSSMNGVLVYYPVSGDPIVAVREGDPIDLDAGRTRQILPELLRCP